MSLAAVNGPQETKDSRKKIGYRRHVADRKLIGKLWHEIPDPVGKVVAKEYTARTGNPISDRTCSEHAPPAFKRKPYRRRLMAPTTAPVKPQTSLSSLRKEVEAMNTIVTVLDGLEGTSRDRVLSWIFDRVV
jgi:hypothetical protein